MGVNPQPGTWRKRSLILAALAVLVPAAALAVLQIRTLMRLEDETRAALRESLRQTIRAYDDNIEERIYGQVLRVLEKVAATNIRRDQIDEHLAVLGDFVDDSGAIDRLAVVRLCECDGQFALVAGGDRPWVRFGEPAAGWPWRTLQARARVPARTGASSDRQEPPAREELAAFADDDRVADTDSENEPRVPQTRRNLRRRLQFVQVEARSDEDGEDRRGLYAFVQLERHTVAARIPREALFELARASVDKRPAGDAALGAPQFRLVRAGTWNTLDGAPPPAATRIELREDLAEPLSAWAIAALYSEHSIADVARQSLIYNLVLLGAVLAALLGGIVFSLRAFARQAKLAELKSSFVSNVSHEMRTPLALISLYSETLEMGRIANPDKARHYMRVIHRESKRLAQMVNNVLDFSRMESGRKHYRFEPCHIDSVVDSVLGDYREPIADAGFSLDTDIAPDLPVILADRNAVSQAVLNLVDNAVKYSPDEKAIAVRALQRDAEIAIEVQDRGIGIPAADIDRIFDKFHRVGTALTAATRGTGLGLALAKHTAEAHGGRIEVESTPGRGSRFTLWLPVEPGHQPAEALSTP